MKLPVGTFKANVSAILLLCVLSLANSAKALEKPDYEVLLDLGKIEYRLYESFIVVETVVQNDDYNAAVEEGFDRLYGYISGSNSASDKISMTVPVQMARTDSSSAVSTSETPEGIRMAFMLPSEYNMESAPVPINEYVEVKKLPERMVAAIRFSGRWTERNLTKNEERLIENIEEQQLETIGPSVFAAYHPPFMPPFLRRNEILFEVTGLPAELERISSGD